MRGPLSEDMMKKLLLPPMSGVASDEMTLNIGRVINSLEEGSIAAALRPMDRNNFVANVGMLLSMRINDGGRLDQARMRAYMASPKFVEDSLNLASWIGAVMQIWAPDHFDELKRDK